MMWGKHKENGVWKAKNSRWMVMLFGGDRLIYGCFGKFRVRLLKPWSD